VGVVGAGVALVASFTHPFTVGADVVTAVPLAVVFVVTLVRLLARKERSESLDPSAAVGPAADRGWLWWWAPVLAVTGWELYCYVSLPRVDHPTLSVLIDMLDSTGVGKFVAFVLWLSLGWFLVTS
jgi:hypothetical protein